MEIDRMWAMPSSDTFSIKPISDMLDVMCRPGWVIVDPFARNSKRGTITNDIAPETSATYHMDALEFLQTIDDESVDMVLFDPPYSPRQVSECYKKLDMTVTMQDTQAAFWTKIKIEISRIVKPGKWCITFGWNSGGIGEKYYFSINRILLVAHGGWHNDTICTAEQKHHEKQEQMFG